MSAVWFLIFGIGDNGSLPMLVLLHGGDTLSDFQSAWMAVRADFILG